MEEKEEEEEEEQEAVLAQTPAYQMEEGGAQQAGKR